MEYMENISNKHARSTIKRVESIVEPGSGYGEKRTKVWSENLTSVSLWTRTHISLGCGCR
jgi:hypothetical protein